MNSSYGTQDLHILEFSQNGRRVFRRIDKEFTRKLLLEVLLHGIVYLRESWTRLFSNLARGFVSRRLKEKTGGGKEGKKGAKGTRSSRILYS
jgi:hypothetical protein